MPSTTLSLTYPKITQGWYHHPSSQGPTQNLNQIISGSSPSTIIFSLPHVVLEILHNLDYYDLKCMQRVSRGIEELIYSPELDGKLFRPREDHAVEREITAETLNHFKLHPAFSKIEWISGMGPNDRYPVDSTYYRSSTTTYPLEETKLLNEPAIYPPVEAVGVGKVLVNSNLGVSYTSCARAKENGLSMLDIFACCASDFFEDNQPRSYSMHKLEVLDDPVTSDHGKIFLRCEQVE